MRRSTRNGPAKFWNTTSSYSTARNFAQLGRLMELRFDLDSANRDFPLLRFGDCQVVCTPDGQNIYFVGSDQAIDLESLNIASSKDQIELGPCTYIKYHTVKGFHDFTPTDYYHRFGEEDRIYPTLMYDRLDERPLFDERELSRRARRHPELTERSKESEWQQCPEKSALQRIRRGEEVRGHRPRRKRGER